MSGETAAHPLVVVVVLNWNGYEDTVECVRNVGRLDYPNVKTVIVDNGSSDGSADRLEVDFPEATLLRLTENYGYSGGNNAGIRLALEQKADYVLLLNNDAVLAENSVTELVAAARDNPAAGVLGCVVYEHARPAVIEHAGGRVNLALGYHGRALGLGKVGTEEQGSPRKVDWVTGCAMMLTRSVLESVGLLDEDFFCYCEDTDLCLRAHGAGFEILIAPCAKAWHKGFRASGRKSPVPIYYLVRNQNILLSRHKPFRSAVLSRLREAVVLMSTLAYIAISKRPQRASVRAALRGQRDYRAHRLGRFKE